MKGKSIFTPLTQALPNHSFHITESSRLLPTPQEILLGIRSGIQTFTTQRLQFRSGVATQRPGALTTVIDNGVLYPILFLHLRSLPTPIGYGTRDDQVVRALEFRKDLMEEAERLGMPAHYIFCGDLNTMGVNLTYSENDLSATDELGRMKKLVEARKVEINGIDSRMRLQTKTHPTTWSNGTGATNPPTDLDHVFAADTIQFADQGGGATVRVTGWVDEATPAAQDSWIAQNSDHSLLFFEVA